MKNLKLFTKNCLFFREKEQVPTVCGTIVWIAFFALIILLIF